MRYHFKYTNTAEAFLNWNDHDVQQIQVGVRRRVRGKKKTEMGWTTRKIPVMYVHLISQLEAENTHGDHNTGHEALRRQSYARQVLAGVARELLKYKGHAHRFRSRVLTPILQRYLRGVPDSHTPFIRRAIAGDDTDPTIADATEFYLSADPIDSGRIRFYRRNLVYIVESRWYLGILLGKISVSSVADFTKVRENHDIIMDSFEEEAPTPTNSESEGGSEDTPYTFNTVEVRMIKSEGLEDFFKEELLAMVRPSVPSLAIPDPTVLQENLKKDQNTAGKQQKRRRSGGSDPGVHATGSKKSHQVIASDEDDV